MAAGSGHKAAGQTIRQTVGEGSGKPLKSGKQEPDRRQVWAGKKRIRQEPNQGMTQKHKSIVDRVHLPVAQLGQIGLKSTLMPEYFSIRGAGSQIQEHHESHSCNAKIKNPVQIDLWTGFRIF